MKKTVSSILCAAILAGSVIMSASSVFSAPFGRIMYGDATRNGKVDLKDVALTMQACAGWKLPDGKYDSAAADVCPDGTVDSRDITYLIRHIVGVADCAVLPEGYSANVLDLYVARDGNDEGDGTKDHPFATIEAARDAIRRVDKSAYDGITVNVAAGDYPVERIDFTAEDSGTESCPITYRADGEVMLNSGITVDPAQFAKVTDERMLSRLKADVRDKVYQADLTSLGLDADDWGNIHAYGAYNTAAAYDGDYTGSYSFAVYENDARMTLARYPDTGYLRTGELISVGQTYVLTPVRNPVSDVYAADDELCARISSWETLDDVWMFGYWGYDWADGSTPLGSFDAENKTISPKFVSYWSPKKNAPYCFFNVFEELDCPGEWYLDRTTGILYIYPTKDISEENIELSVSTSTMIVAQSVNYFTIDGFTLKNTRGDAIRLFGNYDTIRNCTVKNISGNAIAVYGSEDFVQSNEIYHTGCSGIYAEGGNFDTLTPGNIIVDNNYIHDWSEICQTYQPAIHLRGVGNIARHNEIENSPHQAISYIGNNHIIEYNHISRVCLLSSDAGAIYAGRSWVCYGNVMRYNLIEKLGSGTFTPVGIYWDDALSGQTAYGNLMINLPGYSFQLGGGRDNIMYNNIIFNDTGSSVIPISYDERAIAGITDNGWWTSARKGGILWWEFDYYPWQGEIWQTAFPQMARFSDDFDDLDNPDFIPNPAYSVIKDNLILAKTDKTMQLGYFEPKVYRYSDVEDNVQIQPKANSVKKYFVDPENGDYRLRDDNDVWDEIPALRELPIGEIGRRK